MHLTAWNKVNRGPKCFTRERYRLVKLRGSLLVALPVYILHQLRVSQKALNCVWRGIWYLKAFICLTIFNAKIRKIFEKLNSASHEDQVLPILLSAPKVNNLAWDSKIVDSCCMDRRKILVFWRTLSSLLNSHFSITLWNFYRISLIVDLAMFICIYAKQTLSLWDINLKFSCHTNWSIKNLL